MRHRRAPAAPGHGAGPPEERSLSRLAARFVGSFPAPRPDLPLDPPLPEVAFVGRSNVGKSSLINALTGTDIAKVSGTPGKTRALNVFLVEEPPPPCYLVDLPGYGYARVPAAERRKWRRLLARYLAERPTLAGVVWLLDIRQDPSDDDRELHRVYAQVGVSVLAAVTKADKLPRGQRAGRLAVICGALGLDQDQAILTSAKTGDGVKELSQAIRAVAKERG